MTNQEEEKETKVSRIWKKIMEEGLDGIEQEEQIYVFVQIVEMKCLM